jgi:hypothetical protein
MSRCDPSHLLDILTAIKEWCSLIELGFIPRCMAFKLGELERRGACEYPVFVAVVCPPVFSAVPVSAGPQHFCALFGLPSVFTGCSVIGRVVFRCADWKFAFDNAVTSRADFVVSAKLALMIQCYPFMLQGLPFGNRFLQN